MNATFENENEEHIPFLVRVADRANAILVKETRQALKSRQFVVSFLLLLTGAWLFFTYGMLSAGSAIEYGSTGRIFFFGFYFGLLVASVLFVPYGAYRSLLVERDLDTFELLHITTLSPRQIVWGKLLSAIVQLFIFYSALIPFIAFTALLQGFDLPSSMFLLVMTLLLSIFLSTFALMLSSFTDKGAVSQGMTSLVVIGGLVLSLIGTLAVSGAISANVLPFSDPLFWWGVGSVVAFGATYFVLFQQITVARLTFDSGNRSTGIRLICMFQFFLFWLDYMLAARMLPRPVPSAAVLVLCVLSVLHWSAVGLFATTEGDFLSRRIRRDLPRSTLRRWLLTPFLPGGNRGFLYVMGNLVLLWIIATVALTRLESVVGGIFYPEQWQKRLGAAFTFNVPLWTRELRAITYLICYCLIFLSGATLMSRWSQRLTAEIRPIYVRVVLMGLLAASIFTPHLLAIMKLIQPVRLRYSFFFLADPFSSIEHLERRGPMSEEIVFAMLGIAAFGILINIPAVIRGVLYVMTSNVQPRKAVDLTSAVPADE